LFIVIAATFYGTITVGGQFLANLGLSLYEIAILPISVISIPMSLIVMFKREFLISRGVLRFFIVYGLIGGILHVTQFGGIVLGVPVAVVVLLLYTQPIEGVDARLPVFLSAFEQQPLAVQFTQATHNRLAAQSRAPVQPAPVSGGDAPGDLGERNRIGLLPEPDSSPGDIAGHLPGGPAQCVHLVVDQDFIRLPRCLDPRRSVTFAHLPHPPQTGGVRNRRPRS